MKIKRFYKNDSPLNYPNNVGRYPDTMKLLK